MELYQLKTFVSVADCGNVTKSARLLHTTPPSISNHIKALEDALGVVLFTRTTKGMALTQAGELLLDKAQDVLDHADDLFSLAATLQNRLQGYIKLGINANTEYLKVPGLVATVQDRHPTLQMELVPSNTADILNAIEGERLDCGFAFGDADSNTFETIHLDTARICIVIPTRFAERSHDATWKDIAALPWIVPLAPCPFIKAVEATLKNHDLVLSNTVFANDDISKRTLIEQGTAVTAVEEFEAVALERANKAVIWLPKESLFASLSVVYLKKRSQDAAILKFVNLVKELWRIQ